MKSVYSPLILATFTVICTGIACSEVIFDDSVGVGRRFDGIGGLSGGGATSKLLVNYPEKQRSQILDYLFKPQFGASLQILKVEIGGDAQSTDGTEASHMHNSWDESYQRGYEWWLMTEAKKRNPNIKLYSLPWAFPGWIGQGTRNPYKDPEITSMYIVKWLLGAKKYYNLTIDYVGIWNERHYDITYIKTLRKNLDKNNLQATRIVAADEKWEIAKDILKDSELASAVDIIGAHYPGTTSTHESVETGKQLWSSEDFSTFNDNTGGGCWARILNQNYVNGNISSTISWNLIASYYKKLPYFRNGLMTAVEPWSGNYDVNSPIWMTAHTSQFTNIGWNYLKHGYGVGHFESGGSYVSFVSPDKKQLTIVIETMTHNHSVCIRPFLPPYTVHAATVQLKLQGSFAGLKELNVWYSKPSFGSEPDVIFSKQTPLKIVNGMVSINLKPDEVMTLTTLTGGQKGTYGVPPSSSSFPLPYTDNFEAYKEGQEPYYFVPQVGSFEVQVTESPVHKNVMTQVVLAPPIAWCPIILDFPFTVGGNGSWSDIYAEVDVKIGPVNGTEGVFIAARVNRGGCEAFLTMGIFFFIFPKDSSYQLSNDLARVSIIASGPLNNVTTGWNKISILVKGKHATGTLNGATVFSRSIPKKPEQGFVGLGTSTWGLASFDNLKITTADQQSAHKDTNLYFIPGVH